MEHDQNSKAAASREHPKVIDAGHGGGQVLRTVLSLAALTGTAVDIRNIRKSRDRPGLQPQHLACVHAVAAISGGTLQDDAIGASHVVFRPGPVKGGHYAFDIGTAGSCSLLLQCVLPPLLFAEAPSFLTIRGGTDVPFSPPSLFLKRIFAPALEKMGAHVSIDVKRHGFYPKGGGVLDVRIEPAGRLRPLPLASFGMRHEAKRSELRATILSCGLPEHVAQREKTVLARYFDAADAQNRPAVQDRIEIRSVESSSPGNLVFLEAGYGAGSLAMGFDALGKIGKSAESVAQDAADAFRRFEESSDAIEPHLLDQLLLYAALAGSPTFGHVGNGRTGGDDGAGQGRSCRFKVGQLSDHGQSNLRVIHELLGTSYTFADGMLVLEGNR